jgi:hypothetical protein
MKYVAGSPDDAFVVTNRSGRPCTKHEVVHELRNVAQLTGTPGKVTGHTMRVTGAQRLALAGISDTRITTFGRWTSAAFRKYVREAVLGINGGDLAAQVEQRLLDQQVYACMEGQAQASGAPDALLTEFKHRVFSNPQIALTNKVIEERWRTYLSEVERELQAAKTRALPEYCMSEAGITHAIVDHRLTQCGWLWSQAANCRTVESTSVTCRKCAGSSVRWGSA